MKLICRLTPSNAKSKMRFGKYVFGWDSDLKPIPLEFDEDTAETLLAMRRKPCPCSEHRIPEMKVFERAN
jgi:hypothetical protein